MDLMARRYTEHELELYLDESLPVAEMAAIEAALRSDGELIGQLAAINGRRDAGVHTLGEIWRRHRVSCPTRQELGSFLLGAIAAELQDYIKFHLETVGCRLCQANVADLQAQKGRETAAASSQRRSRYFQSSAGYLKHD
jgi:hypothetical protein